MIEAGEYATLNLEHPEILKAILYGILETGHFVRQEGRRTTLAVTVDNWLFDELAALEDGGEAGDDALSE